MLQVERLGGSSKNSQGRPSKSAFVASKGTNDRNWVLDMGVTNHITNDSSNLGNPIPYDGQDGLLLGNSSTIPISSIGSVVVPIKHDSFLLKNVFHAPNVATNFVSVQQLCKDNHDFLEFRSNFFYIKDIRSRESCSKVRLIKGFTSYLMQATSGLWFQRILLLLVFLQLLWCGIIAFVMCLILLYIMSCVKIKFL